MLLPMSNDVKSYLYDTLDFAEKLNKHDELVKLLFRLGSGFWNNGHEYICLLGRDFYKHSFTFACYDLYNIKIYENEEEREINYSILEEADPWMCGGLIYHGPELDGSKEETFSVELNPSDGWSIHT